MAEFPLNSNTIFCCNMEPMSLSSVTDTDSPFRRCFPLQNCHSQGFNFHKLLPLLQSELEVVSLLVHYVVLYYTSLVVIQEQRKQWHPDQHFCKVNHIRWQRQLLKVLKITCEPRASNAVDHAFSRDNFMVKAH